MIKLVRTDSNSQDFIALVKFLDADLAEKDGEEHSFYNQFNKIGTIKHVVVAYENERPRACGAIKEYGADAMEVKRMYVAPESRKKGFAIQILSELEKWAVELGCGKCILETGKRQPEAIALYKKTGYSVISNYGPYVGMSNSVCFEKRLNKK